MLQYSTENMSLPLTRIICVEKTEVPFTQETKHPAVTESVFRCIVGSPFHFNVTCDRSDQTSGIK